MKRYKFQALVTLGPPHGEGAPPAMRGGLTQRLVVRGQRHQTGRSRYFCALATRNGEDVRWSDDDHMIMTIVLVGDEPREYFEVGDTFTVWMGRDLARGIVTRRLFI
jgi:hypothetical protein